LNWGTVQGDGDDFPTDYGFFCLFWFVGICVELVCDVSDNQPCGMADCNKPVLANNFDIYKSRCYTIDKIQISVSKSGLEKKRKIG
jgi:hypothetical protein